MVCYETNLKEKIILVATKSGMVLGFGEGKRSRGNFYVRSKRVERLTSESDRAGVGGMAGVRPDEVGSERGLTRSWLFRREGSGR